MRRAPAALLAVLAVHSACATSRHVETAPGGSPGGEATKATQEGARSESGAVVEFMGVRYGVMAEPVKAPKGWGVLVRIEAEITDGEDHMFVNDVMQAGTGLLRIRAGILGRKRPRVPLPGRVLRPRA
jgi:hypothetical protein